MLAGIAAAPDGIPAWKIGPSPSFRVDPMRWAMGTAFLALAYALTARASICLAFAGTNVSPVWPPSGLAFAALLVFGPSLWPGILAGAFAANFAGFAAYHDGISPSHFAASGWIGLGNAFEAALAATLCRRWLGGGAPSDAVRILKFLIILLASCLFAALNGGLALGITGLASWALFPEILRTWWLGDLAGILVLAPLLITAARQTRRPDPRRLAESFAFLSLLVLLGYLVFHHGGGTGSVQPMAYAITPFLVLLVFRCGPVTGYLGLFLVTIIAILGTWAGAGPFSANPMNERLLLLQAFAGVLSLTLIFVNASLDDRDAAAGALHLANATLERKVEERTAESLIEREKAERFAAFATRAMEETEAANRGLAASEARMRQLSDAGFEGLVIHDLGLIRMANRAAAEMFGYPTEEFLGKRLSEYIAPESIPEVQENIRKSHEGTLIAIGLRKDGSRFQMEVRGKPIEFNGRTMRVVAVRDITERRKAEEMQVQAMEALQSANRAKSEFLAHMSHEIRTPLNGILGMTAALEATPLDDEQKRYLSIMGKCGEALLDQVNGILDLARIESGSMSLESAEFELAEAVDSALAPYLEQARGRGLKTEWDLSPLEGMRARGDAKRLRQVIANLAGNAVKFTGTGSVRVEAAAEDKGRTLAFAFRIADTGIGMEPSVLERIFLPFVQGDASMSRKYGGSGLGLAICKQLAELMGGSISAESRPGEGSVFRFACDFLKAEPATHARPARTRAHPILPRPSAAGAGPKVLVVEDDPINQEVARIFLGRHARELAIVSSGQEALARFVEGHFDLVLMDCQLPGMDGLATTEALRRASRGRNGIRIVAMTANAAQGDRERCLAAGMDDYLVKPLDAEKVAAMLARAAREAADA